MDGVELSDYEMEKKKKNIEIIERKLPNVIVESTGFDRIVRRTVKRTPSKNTR